MMDDRDIPSTFCSYCATTFGALTGHWRLAIKAAPSRGLQRATGKLAAGGEFFVVTVAGFPLTLFFAGHQDQLQRRFHLAESGELRLRELDIETGLP
jgi:hypothetical protein